MSSSEAEPVFESEAGAARQSDQNLVLFYAECHLVAGMRGRRRSRQEKYA